MVCKANTLCRSPAVVGACVALVLVGAGLAAGDEYAEGVKLFNGGQFGAAAEKLALAIDLNPGNSRAYLYAALCREKLGEWEGALKCWQAYEMLAPSVSAKRLAAAHIKSCKAKLTPAKQKKPDRRTDHQALLKVERNTITVRTERFLVRTRNRLLSQMAAERSEQYLDELMDLIMRGRAWPRVTSVDIYATHGEYVKKTGMPRWSGGGFQYIPLGVDNIIRRVNMFQLDKKGQYRKDLIPNVLPHELTHLVLEEYFGERRMPLALNEGLAMYMERTRETKHDADLARIVKEGKHIPLTKLFDFRSYPRQVGLFYLQSVSFVRFFVGIHGRDGITTLLEELKHGRSMNHAMGAATGRRGNVLAAIEGEWRKAVLAEAAKAPQKKP